MVMGGIPFKEDKAPAFWAVYAEVMRQAFGRGLGLEGEDGVSAQRSRVVISVKGTPALGDCVKGCLEICRLAVCAYGCRAQADGHKDRRDSHAGSPAAGAREAGLRHERNCTGPASRHSLRLSRLGARAENKAYLPK